MTLNHINSRYWRDRATEMRTSDTMKDPEVVKIMRRPAAEYGKLAEDREMNLGQKHFFAVGTMHNAVRSPWTYYPHTKENKMKRIGVPWFWESPWLWQQVLGRRGLAVALRALAPPLVAECLTALERNESERYGRWHREQQREPQCYGWRRRHHMRSRLR